MRPGRIEIKDFLMRRIYQIIYSVLRRILTVLDLVRFETQGQFAEDMREILEEISGMRMEELESIDIKGLGYLLKLRCEGEMRLCLSEVLKVQSKLATRFDSFGKSTRWKDLAEILDSGTGEVVDNPQLKKSLDQLREKSASWS